MGLNSKDEAMKKALIMMVERKNKEQKACIFGEKVGPWDNPEGTVISISKNEDVDWFRVRLYKTVVDFENNGNVLSEIGTGREDYVDTIGLYFMECMFKNFTRKDMFVNLAYKQYKIAFENFYDDWTGAENNENNRLVIAMIGSTRFYDSFLDKCWDFSALGYIVSLPNFRPVNKMAKGFDIPEDLLEDIGFKRIEKADKVYVVNEDGYIGSSTRKEIEYARSLGKNIKYMEET